MAELPSPVRPFCRIWWGCLKVFLAHGLINRREERSEGNQTRDNQGSAPSSGLAQVVWILPVVGVLGPLACSTALVDSFELPKLFVLKIGLALALLSMAAGARVERGVLRSPAALAVLLFLGLNVLATLGSVEPRTSLLGNYQSDQGLLTLAVMIGYFFVAASWIRTEAALVRLAAGVTLAASCAGIYGIAQQVGLDPLGWPAIDPARRAIGTFGHPDNLGEFLVMTLPLTVWLAWGGRGLRRDLSLWAIGVQLAALAVTQARAAWIALGLQVLIFGPLLIYLRSGSNRRLPQLLVVVPQAIALTACLILLVVPASAGLIDRFVGRGEPLERRQELWRSALAMTADRPLLGWGPDTFELVYPAYRSTALDALENVVLRPDIAHNVLLGTAVNAGFLGAAAYLGVHVTVLLVLLGALFGTAKTASTGARPAALALLSVWSSYLVVSLFGRPQVSADWLAWMVGGAALGLFGGQATSQRRIRGIGRLVPLVLALGLIVEAGTGLAADAAYGQAIGARDQGSPADSVVWVQRAIILRPFEPGYRHYLGLSLADLAREGNDSALFRSAIDQLSQASTLLGQRDAELLVQLARTVAEGEAAAGHSTDAPWEYVQQAIGLDPENPLLHTEAADLAANLNQPALAREYWEAARVRARSSDALRRLGRVALRLGDPTAAREAFQMAIKPWWPDRTRAQYYRYWGEAALSAGLPDEASLAFAKAVELTPNDLGTRLQWAEALAADGQRLEALAEAQRVLEQAPADRRAAELVEQLSLDSR